MTNKSKGQLRVAKDGTRVNAKWFDKTGQTKQGPQESREGGTEEEPPMTERKFIADSAECDLLCEEFGQKNVEQTLIHIAHARDSTGLHVAITPTYEMVRAILEAVHGRLNVGAIRLKGFS